MNAGNKHMDFPFKNWIVSEENYASLRLRELLAYPHGMHHVLLDLNFYAEEMQMPGEQHAGAHYLSDQEQDYFAGLASVKRQREWLGGRYAAKYSAAGLLREMGYPHPWYSLAVFYDENGRPFLRSDKNGSDFPDISISHSGRLAAAMAVSKGLCGIDIQKVTPRVVKVQERFCSTAEEAVLRTFFHNSQDNHSIILTKLWAAKEALRKTANTGSLPGFSALELSEIYANAAAGPPATWKFIFLWKKSSMSGNPVNTTCSAVVCLYADYALALTVRQDTVG